MAQSTYYAEGSLYKTEITFNADEDKSAQRLSKKDSAGNAPLVTSSKVFNQLVSSQAKQSGSKTTGGVNQGLFEPVPTSAVTVAVSSLTTALANPGGGLKKSKGSSSGAEVTIFLPDRYMLSRMSLLICVFAGNIVLYIRFY